VELRSPIIIVWLTIKLFESGPWRPDIIRYAKLGDLLVIVSISLWQFGDWRVNDMPTGCNVRHAVAVTSSGDVSTLHLLAQRVRGRIAAKPGIEVPPGLYEVLSKLAELCESYMISQRIGRHVGNETDLILVHADDLCTLRSSEAEPRNVGHAFGQCCSDYEDIGTAGTDVCELDVELLPIVVEPSST